MDLSDLNSEVREKYKPLSPWAYWGYSILFAIPIIGLIFLIVFCFAGENVNRKNYARGFVLTFVMAIIAIIIMFSLGGLAISWGLKMNPSNTNSANNYNSSSNSYDDFDIDQVIDAFDSLINN